MNASPVVHALHLGSVREVPSFGTAEWWDKPWQTGFFKPPASGPCWLGYEGFRGDEQADRRNHGGSEKAVCAYPMEHYSHWRQEPALALLETGAFGENLCTLGLVETGVCIGDEFALGGARVQVSQPRQPCWKLARRWRVKDLAARVERTGFTGYYFRVLRHGEVRAGDPLDLCERPFPQWSVARCHEIMHRRGQDPAELRSLSECPLLSASWKDALWARAQSSQPG